MNQTNKLNNLFSPVLSMIKESQLQHGMRHGDHQRYRYLINILLICRVYNIKGTYYMSVSLM